MRGSPHCGADLKHVLGQLALPPAAHRWKPPPSIGEKRRHLLAGLSPYLDDVRQLLQARRVGEQPGTCGGSGVGAGSTLRRQFSPLPRGSPLGQQDKHRGCWGCPGPKSMARLGAPRETNGEWSWGTLWVETARRFGEESGGAHSSLATQPLNAPS